MNSQRFSFGNWCLHLNLQIVGNMGSKMEKIVEQGLLYDFYGELLTEHQKKIYEDVVYNDFSLTEIARENGISRQGVHDLVRRCNHILQGYEDKLHLVERFLRVKENVSRLEELSNNPNVTRQELVQEVRLLSHQILEEL
jgi:predicted DNA-binding protein YlxM (UPF0122 family)